MYAELSVSEADRMLRSIKKLGKFHQNSKFLAQEALSDLRTAERNLSSLDPEEASSIKKRIAGLRAEIVALGIT